MQTRERICSHGCRDRLLTEVLGMLVLILLLLLIVLLQCVDGYLGRGLRLPGWLLILA